MNVVKILLILGLGYVALNQKVEKTRNMLLVVTGLLAFCMFSMEGFTIAEEQFDIVFGTASQGAGSPANTVTGTGGARTVTGSDDAVYTTTGAINSNPLSGISCLVGAGGASGTPTPVAGTGSDPITTAHNISELFTCAAATTTGQSCSAGATAGKKCPSYYKVKTGNCAADPCLDTEFAATGACCEKVCSEADCDDWKIFGIGSGERQECKEEVAGGFVKYYCNEGS